MITAFLLKRQKIKEAIPAFKKAVALNANFGEAFFQLGWCYNEEGLYNEAIDALKKEEMNQPKDRARTHLEIGYAYEGLEKYDDAIARFNSALQLDDAYSLVYKERGNCYYKKKDYEKALADFTKYSSLEGGDIEDADFWYRKGWCENEFDKFSEAVVSLKKEVAQDDRNADGFSELGFAYYKLNLNDESINNYRIAMGLDATNYHPVLGIADVYYDNLKNYDSAAPYYEKGVQLTRTNKLAFYRLGWCYNDKKKYADALKPLQQAISLDAGYNSARNELGYAYYKLDQYDNALSQFGPIMTKDPKDELSRYYAGFCYYLKGDQDNLKKMIAELKALNSATYAETLTKYVK